MSFGTMLGQLATGMLVTGEIFFLTLLFSLPLGLVISFGRMSKTVCFGRSQKSIFPSCAERRLCCSLL